MDAEEKPTNFLTQARDWKSAAVFGTVVGMLTGAAATGNAKVRQVIGDFPRTEFADTLGKQFRLSRVARGSINEGLITGTYFGMYYGLHNWVAEKRGVVDLTNCIVAGAATTCTLATMVAPPGTSAIVRARRAAYGLILGAVYFVPMGWLDLKVLEREKKQATR